MRRNGFGVKMGLAVAAAAIMSGAMAQVAAPGNIEAAPLATDAFSTGTLTSANGALTPDLWRGADARTLEFLLDNLPARLSAPSLGEAMRRTLLSPGTAPDGAQDSLGGKKLLALARAGFAAEAATVASLSNAGRGDPWTGRAEAVNDLLSGDVQRACARGQRLTSGRDEAFWVKLRVLCFAAADQRDAADLSLSALRDQFGLNDNEEALLTAAATGATPKTPPLATTPLEYAAARMLDLPMSPGLVSEADGAVLVAVANDDAHEPATRIAAAQRASAMGVMSAANLSSLMSGVEFDVAALGEASAAAETRPNDPLTDALLYQSTKAMNAPEFVRDKARRVSEALSLSDTFYRAYALSVLYADDIAALDGTIVAPDEAAQFAAARMAVGDSVGAGRWLSAMLGPDASVGALPENQAISFIELVNLLSILDPQTASGFARNADVSLLNGAAPPADAAKSLSDPVIAAHILEAAFDAALDEKPGQAGLAALAASRASSGPAGAVVVSQSLKAAGMDDLRRRYAFERAWAARFPDGETASSSGGDEAQYQAGEGGLKPRIKPAPGP